MIIYTHPIVDNLHIWLLGDYKQKDVYTDNCVCVYMCVCVGGYVYVCVCMCTMYMYIMVSPFRYGCGHCGDSICVFPSSLSWEKDREDSQGLWDVENPLKDTQG